MLIGIPKDSVIPMNSPHGNRLFQVAMNKPGDRREFKPQPEVLAHLQRGVEQSRPLEDLTTNHYSVGVERPRTAVSLMFQRVHPVKHPVGPL